MAFGVQQYPSYGPQMLGGLAQQSLGGYQQAMQQQPQLLNSGLQAAMSQIGQAQALRANIMQRAHLAAQEQQQQAAQQMGQMFMTMAAQRQQAQQAAQALQQHALLSSLDRQSRESMNTQDNQTRMSDASARQAFNEKELAAHEKWQAEQNASQEKIAGMHGAGGNPLDIYGATLTMKHLQGTATPEEEAAYQKGVQEGVFKWESDKDAGRNLPPALKAADALLSSFDSEVTAGAKAPQLVPKYLPEAQKIYPNLTPALQLRMRLLFGAANFEHPEQATTAPARGYMDKLKNMMSDIGSINMLGMQYGPQPPPNAPPPSQLPPAQWFPTSQPTDENARIMNLLLQSRSPIPSSQPYR